jgi:hypothetical protein
MVRVCTPASPENSKEVGLTIKFDSIVFLHPTAIRAESVRRIKNILFMIKRFIISLETSGPVKGRWLKII